MQDFDSLKNIWQQAATGNEPAAPTISNASTNSKIKLQQQQLKGAIMLSLTAVFIAALAIFGHLNFQHWYTYAAMAIICLICLVQAAICYFTYNKIKSINETVAPAMHLQQWEAYYAFRKKQLHFNMPVYYIALNLALGLYFIEIFSGRPVLNVMIILAIYAAWMLFAYFYLGKKSIRKEDEKLNNIIDELIQITSQLNDQ